MCDAPPTDFESRRRDGVERLHLSVSLPEMPEPRITIDTRHIELWQAFALGVLGGLLGGAIVIGLMT